MPFGASRPSGSGGENVNHFTSVRLRLQGTGNLQMALWSMDDIRSTTLLPLPMALLTRIEPNRLTNFIEQRALLEGKTTVINEFVRINRIIIFAKTYGTEYPQ